MQFFNNVYQQSKQYIQSMSFNYQRIVPTLKSFNVWVGIGAGLLAQAVTDSTLFALTAAAIVANSVQFPHTSSNQASTSAAASTPSFT